MKFEFQLYQYYNDDILIIITNYRLLYLKNQSLLIVIYFAKYIV